MFALFLFANKRVHSPKSFLFADGISIFGFDLNSQILSVRFRLFNFYRERRQPYCARFVWLYSPRSARRKVPQNHQFRNLMWPNRC